MRSFLRVLYSEYDGLLDALQESPFIKSFIRYPIYNQKYASFSEALTSLGAGCILPVSTIGLSLLSLIICSAVAALSALAFVFSPFIGLGNGCAKLLKNTRQTSLSNDYFFSPEPKTPSTAWDSIKSFVKGSTAGFFMSVLTGLIGCVITAIGCIFSVFMLAASIVAVPSFLTELGIRSTLSGIDYFFPLNIPYNAPGAIEEKNDGIPSY